MVHCVHSGDHTSPCRIAPDELVVVGRCGRSANTLSLLPLPLTDGLGDLHVGYQAAVLQSFKGYG